MTQSKLAVILHADVVGSTALVQKDERIAHERIQTAFRHSSDTISAYGGTTRELRGDALVAEFERASDAIAAALAFQASNTEHNESNPFVAQDESYIVFNVQLPEHDFNPQIYVSFQKDDGTWTRAMSIGESVNSTAGESAATISPDGKYLFFKRRQGKDRGIHWISTEIIERLKPVAPRQR